MEVIYTKFSPSEKVVWNRIENGVEKRSEHIIQSIRTETRMTYTYSSLKGKGELIKGVWFTLLSWFNGSDARRGSDYGKKANSCFQAVRKGGELTTNKITTTIYYYLQGIGEPVMEDQLETIIIEYTGKDKKKNVKSYLQNATPQ